MSSYDEMTYVADTKFFDVVVELEARGWLAVSDERPVMLSWRNLTSTAFDSLEGALVNHLEGSNAMSHKGHFARLLYESTTFYPSCYDVRCEAHLEALLGHAVRAASAAFLQRVKKQGKKGDLAVLRACLEQQGSSEVDFAGLLWTRHFGPEIRAALDGGIVCGSDAEALWALFVAGDDEVDDVTAAFSIHEGPVGSWLVKPAGGSCGVGINVVASLGSILQRARDARWRVVVQKYIERPLLIFDRKFDLRQWILVTQLAPLTVFGFSECYARFASRPMSANLEDRFAHLCNFSVQKDCDGGVIPENMLTGTCLATEHLGIKRWHGEILPRCRQVCLAAVASAAHLLTKRSRGFEWLGVDLMLSEDGQVWLLEVNVSPDVSHSTKVTERLVKAATEDCFKLILDEKQADAQPPRVDQARHLKKEQGEELVWQLWTRDDDSSSGRLAAVPPPVYGRAAEEAAELFCRDLLRDRIPPPAAIQDDSSDEEL